LFLHIGLSDIGTGPQCMGLPDAIRFGEPTDDEIGKVKNGIYYYSVKNFLQFINDRLKF
jgi:hypothetical protein